MGPTSQDIDAMRKLRSIMNEAETVPAKSQNTSSTNLQENVTRTGRPEVDAMADILRKLNAATGNAAQQLVEEAKIDTKLKEALQTEQTPKGVRIGKWEVRVNLKETDEGKKKFYDVANVETGSVVCSDLVVIEAAHAIVRYLNKGIPFVDPKIERILDLEETFNRNRVDAGRFKYRYNRCVKLKEHKAGHVFADRFQVARANAVVAHDQIKSILETIR